MKHILPTTISDLEFLKGGAEAVAVKDSPLEDSDGMFTPRGMEVAARYATRWVREQLRDLDMERQFPEFQGFFYDVRSDPDVALRYADDPRPGSGEPLLVVPR